MEGVAEYGEALSGWLPLGEAALKSREAGPGRPRPETAAALSAYLARLGAPEPALRAARRLGEVDAKARVAGQQAGLFLGPALVFYKVRDLLAGAGTPVFWVASQDHDVAEVRSALWIHEGRLLRFSLPLPVGPPVGRIPYGPYEGAVARALLALAPEPARARDFLDALSGAGSFSEAFARGLLFFFGERGLVPFDPLAPELAPLFREGLRAEIEDPLASVEALEEGRRALKARGLRPTLGTPKGATLLFLEGEDGVRRRLFFESGRFTDGLGTYTREDLLALLDAEPGRITPSAALRPVLQDRVLPTAGFWVGPGELAYVAELPPLYRRHGIEPPAVLQRTRALVLEPPVRRLIARHGLDPWAFAEAPEAAFREALARAALASARVARAVLEGEAAFEEAARALAELDPTLEPALARVRGRLRAEVGRLAGKVARARMQRDAVLRRQFERLRLHLRPGGRLQEFALPYLYFFLHYGEEALEKLLGLPPGDRRVIALGG